MLVVALWETRHDYCLVVLCSAPLEDCPAEARCDHERRELRKPLKLLRLGLRRLKVNVFLDCALRFLEQRLEVDRDRVFVFSQLHVHSAVSEALLDVIVINLRLETYILLYDNKRRSANDCLLVVRLQDYVAVERDAEGACALFRIYHKVSVCLWLGRVRNTRSLLVQRTEVNSTLLHEPSGRISR